MVMVIDPWAITAQVALAEGMVLRGFGKAKFREAPAGDLDPDVDIMFEVSSESFGILDNVASSFGDMLTEASKKKPDNCRICYHKAEKDPEDAWNIVKD